MGAFLRRGPSIALACVAPIALACSSGPISVGDDRNPVTLPDAGPIDSGSGTGGAGGAGYVDALVPPTPGDLVAVTASCAKQISSGMLQPRPNGPSNVPICQLSNAIFWTSGLAVICAGKSTATCNSTTDPQFQPKTTAIDSHGEFLDAAALPYVEVSAPTSTFDYRTFGLKMGTVVAVIHRDKLSLEYGIVGTVGQADIIGDASYAMASSLGIDPDPVTGGTSSAVTYIAFNNPGVAVTVMESHDEAVKLGQAAAAALVQAGK